MENYYEDKWWQFASIIYAWICCCMLVKLVFTTARFILYVTTNFFNSTNSYLLLFAKLTSFIHSMSECYLRCNNKIAFTAFFAVCFIHSINCTKDCLICYSEKRFHIQSQLSIISPISRIPGSIRNPSTPIARLSRELHHQTSQSRSPLCTMHRDSIEDSFGFVWISDSWWI